MDDRSPTSEGTSPPSTLLPTTGKYIHLYNDNFVLAAGSVLFRLSPSTSPRPGTLQICVLHNRKRSGIWALPKGHKDVSESLEAAALRETYEETGYRCEFLPCTMYTRAHHPGIYTGPKPHLEPASTEPFTITLQQQGDGSTKLIFWYLTRVVDTSVPQEEGTQMASEDFEAHFLDAKEAVEKITSAGHRELAELALSIVERNGFTQNSGVRGGFMTST